MGGFKCLEEFPKGEGCQFCLSNSANETMLGPIYKIGNMAMHYYCLLLASEIEQNGRDRQGLLGFFPKDIKKELDRGSKRVCSYCHCFGATVKCCGKGCDKVFHLPCGQMRGSLSQFYKEFKSYCVRHKPLQKIPYSLTRLKTIFCVFCAGRVTRSKSSTEVLWPSCCKAPTLFHRECIQKMACSAGHYHFRCPLCNSTKEFKDTMLLFGIYVPEREASWEREPNAFAELLQRYSNCDAVDCQCPGGRGQNKSNSEWQLELCQLCGSSGIHLKCSGVWSKNSGIYDLNWKCPTCTSIESAGVQRYEGDEDSRASEGTESVEVDEPESPTANLTIGQISPLAADQVSDCITISDTEDEEIDVEALSSKSEEEGPSIDVAEETVGRRRKRPRGRPPKLPRKRPRKSIRGGDDPCEVRICSSSGEESGGGDSGGEDEPVYHASPVGGGDVSEECSIVWTSIQISRARPAACLQPKVKKEKIICTNSLTISQIIPSDDDEEVFVDCD